MGTPSATSRRSLIIRKRFIAAFITLLAVLGFASTAPAAQAYQHVENTYQQCNYQAWTVANVSNIQGRFPITQTRLYRNGSTRYSDNDVYVQILFVNVFTGDRQTINCRYTGVDGYSTVPPYVTNVSFMLVWPS